MIQWILRLQSLYHFVHGTYKNPSQKSLKFSRLFFTQAYFCKDLEDLELLENCLGIVLECEEPNSIFFPTHFLYKHFE